MTGKINAVKQGTSTEGFVGVKEIATFCGVSTRTIHTWTKDHWIPCCVVGGRKLYLPSKVQDAIVDRFEIPAK